MGKIVVIALGTVATSPFGTRVAVLSRPSMLMTVGVYGLVAGIVKLDDSGLHLSQRPGNGGWVRFQRAAGAAILRSAPYLMKALSIAGTAAMFLVGGGILVHGIAPLQHAIEGVAVRLASVPGIGGVLHVLGPMVANALIGVAAGAVILLVVKLARRIWPARVAAK